MSPLRALLIVTALAVLTPAVSEASGPNILSRMGYGAKNFFVKTGEFLSPWKSEPAPRQSVTGTRRVYRPGETKQEERSFFAGWFASEEPQAPLTVSDWLDLPRPE